MSHSCVPLLAAALLLATSCFQSPSPTTVSGEQQGCGSHCGHSTVATRSGSGSSGATTSSTSLGGGSGGTTTATSSSFGGSTSSSSSTSGGSSSDYVTTETFCPSVAVPPLPPTCATGTPFSSQCVDILECLPLPGASLSVISANGVPVSGAAATSQSNGAFQLCLPTDTPFSLQVTAPGYPTTYYAEMLNADAGFFAQLGSVSSDELNAVGAFVPGGVTPTRAIVVAEMAASTCIKERGGWSFSLWLPDGGAFPDSGYQLLYLGSNDLPDPTVTVTSHNGGAVFYNVDPTLSDFVVITAENPDAGGCEVINGTVGLTGRVYIAGGSAAIDPFLLP